MFPTDAKLINRARERLVRLARKAGLDLRQSYVRVGKLALIMHQRYAHAKQFKRANKSVRKLKTYLGRTIRDISVRLPAMMNLRPSSAGRSTRLPPFWSRSSASVAARSTASMPMRWNASARGRLTRPTSSG